MRSEAEVRKTLIDWFREFKIKKEWTLLNLTSEDIQKLTFAFDLIEVLIAKGEGVKR